MTTAIDTNVIIALWDKDPGLSLAAQQALEAAFHRGTMVVAAPVFAELLAARGAARHSSTPFLKRPGSAWIGNCPQQYGGWLAAPFRDTPRHGANNETVAPAAFWRTS
jgi:hypothetical protein